MEKRPHPKPAEVERAVRTIWWIRSGICAWTVVELVFAFGNFEHLARVFTDPVGRGALRHEILHTIGLVLVGFVLVMHGSRHSPRWMWTLALLCVADPVLYLVEHPSFGFHGFLDVATALAGLVLAILALTLLPGAERTLRDRQDLERAIARYGTGDPEWPVTSKLETEVVPHGPGGLLGNVLVVLGVLALVLLSFRGFRRYLRAKLPRPQPAPLVQSLTAFEQVWASGAPADLRVFYPLGQRDFEWAETLKFLKRRGWDQVLPELGPIKARDEQPDGADITYAIDRHTLTVRWVLVGLHWQLDALVVDKH